MQLFDNVVLPVERKPCQHTDNADLTVYPNGLGGYVDVEERGDDCVPAQRQAGNKR